MTIDYGAGANSWLSVSHRQARADSQRGELVDRVAAGPPIGKFLVIEALGHVGVPLAGFRPNHRAGVELAAIDPHRTPEAAADVERGLDDGVAGEAWRDRLEIGDFTGRDAVGHSVPPRRSVRAQGLNLYGMERSCRH